MGVLTMYSEYQYAMVLNILRRNDDCIAITRPWLEENLGKAMTLDYWMFDALGDCYARKGDKTNAIKYYEEAVAAYCRLFNTTEKEIKKSKFKDETLGYTLYDLAMQYATRDISKTYYYASLAAKSGNANAIEYCRKSKISF
jgi:tetratricopeptide (TPR) repeat protein